jgi:hypothetical protein
MVVIIIAHLHCHQGERTAKKRDKEEIRYVVSGIVTVRREKRRGGHENYDEQVLYN